MESTDSRFLGSLLSVTGFPVLAGQKPTVQVCPLHIQQETQPGTESETVPGLYDDEFS